MGSIGTIDAQFTASTGDFTAKLNEVGASLAATGAKAAAAAAKTDAGFRTMTTAAERARQAWQREEIQQDRAAEAAANTARAMELSALKADILARGNDVLARSADVTATAFGRMSASVRASVTAMGEKITAVAEKAELSADGIAAGFGGLGKLLGAGLLGDFAAHMLDNVAALGATLDDLRAKTDISVQSLAGLRLIAQSKDLDFTTISMGLTRLGKALYEAKQGMTEDREAFSSLGISMKEVNSLSVEQMLYRISAAFGKNRDLVIADGTALELFGRGGKELIPILREQGDALAATMKQQGALTGWTNEGAAASQQWRRATSDLSAEFHAGLIPVLIDLVKMLPYVKTGFDLLATGTEMVLGTAINDVVTLTAGIWDLGKALAHLAELHPGKALADLKSLGTANQKGQDIEAANIRRTSVAAGVAWNSRGGDDLVNPFVPGQNQPGDIDGALMKQANQTLAAMEQKKKLSQAQIIKYWQGVLAKAQPGSVDYDQVNLRLGSLMQHAGAGGSRREKSASSGVDWRSMMEEDQANVKATGEMDALSGGAPNLSDTAQQAQTRVKSNSYLAGTGNLLDSQAMAGIEAQGKAFDAVSASLAKYDAAQQAASKSVAEASLKMAEATGRVDKLDAAQLRASMHAGDYADAVGKWKDEMTAAQAMPEGADREKAIGDLNAQVAQMQGARIVEVMQDQQAIGGNTIVGAVQEALDQMVSDWKDMASQIAGTLTRTVGGFNDDIVNLLTKKQIYPGDVGRAFGGTIKEGEQGLLRTGLQRGESGVLGLFGMGGSGKRDGSTAQQALWVQIAAANAAAIGGTQDTIARIFGRKSGSGGPPSAGSDITSFISRAFGGHAGSGSSSAVASEDSGGAESGVARVLGGVPTLLRRTPVAASGGDDGDSGPWQGFPYALPPGDGTGIPNENPGEPTDSTTILHPAPSQASSFVSKITSMLLSSFLNSNRASQNGAGGDDGGGDGGGDITSLTPGGSSGSESMFQGFFAGGGAVIANRPALVGEQGPELFMPSSAGRIVPNHALGGSTVSHHISIDARGSTDPAQTEAAVHRAMRQYMPQTVAASVAAVRDQQMRKPSTRS